MSLICEITMHCSVLWLLDLVRLELGALIKMATCFKAKKILGNNGCRRIKPQRNLGYLLLQVGLIAFDVLFNLTQLSERSHFYFSRERMYFRINN